MVVVIPEIRDETIRYLRRQLVRWGRANFSNFPWRYETNHFHALIAELLLQRTKAEQVVAVYKMFKEHFPDPPALAAASPQEIEAVIAPLGLRWRARFLSDLGKKLVENDRDTLSNLARLRELPGVGPYAAAAYLSLHRGKRASIVDSNVVRFYGRFFGFGTGAETRRDKGVLELADRITPRKGFKNFNYGLIDFTRLVCKTKPLHEICPVSKSCHVITELNGSVDLI
jgi:A/G-specific adenine glycosylase